MFFFASELIAFEQYYKALCQPGHATDSYGLLQSLQ